MARYCPHCGARNPTVARFCGKCEMDMLAPAPAEATPTQTAEKKGCISQPILIIVVALIAGFICIGLGTTSLPTILQPTLTSTPTFTTAPTDTAEPTHTPELILTPRPSTASPTAVPTNTLTPTDTPTP